MMIQQNQIQTSFEQKQFWCHSCQRQFTSHLKPGIDQIICPRCSNDFCQIFTSKTKPNIFQPYQKPLKQKQRRPYRFTTPIILQALAQYSDDINAQKIREITDQDINKLKIKFNRVIQECLICKQQFKIGIQVLKCPCMHIYHIQCLKQWLQYKNSCPKCRQKILDGLEG